MTISSLKKFNCKNQLKQIYLIKRLSMTFNTTLNFFYNDLPIIKLKLNLKVKEQATKIKNTPMMII